MNDKLDLKKLWNQQKGSQPGVADLLIELTELKKTGLRKGFFINLLLILTAFFIIGVIYYFQPQLITTKLGVILIILAIFSFVSASNRLIPMLRKIDQDQSNNEYLQNLISIKTKQHFLQTTMLNLYFILLTSGICLYLYEYTERMPFVWALFSYATTLLWCGFNWFYIRPKTIKNQQKKINDLIEKFEQINRQLKE